MAGEFHTVTAPGMAAPLTVRRVVLTGFMGAGKTTSGSLAARLLGWRFLDSDQVLEARLQTTIADIFATHGEAYFRTLEHENIASLLQEDAAVIALGGGAIEHPETRRLLHTLPETLVLFLDVPLEVVAGRCGGSGTIRPVLQDTEKLASRYSARLPLYQASHCTIPTGNLKPDEVASQIASLVRARTQDTSA